MNAALETLRNLLDEAPRVAELADRLIATGPKAAHVSCSETHEISEFVHAVIAALSASSGVAVAWENFPAYLIDNCEGETISEESLQAWAADMIRNPRYNTAQPSAPVVDDGLDQRIGEYLTSKLPEVAPEIDWADGRYMVELVAGVVALTQQPAKPAGQAVDVLRIQAQMGLDSITVYFEDYAPGQGRATVFCYGDAWTACWGAMGNSTVRDFVASVDPDYLACAFLQLCGADDRRRKYTERISTVIVDALSEQAAKANEPSGGAS